jgi:hypothetical protein
MNFLSGISICKSGKLHENFIRQSNDSHFFLKYYLLSSYRFNLAHQMGLRVKKRRTPHAGFFYINLHPVAAARLRCAREPFYGLQNEALLRRASTRVLSILS